MKIAIKRHNNFSSHFIAFVVNGSSFLHSYTYYYQNNEGSSFFIVVVELKMNRNGTHLKMCFKTNFFRNECKIITSTFWTTLNAKQLSPSSLKTAPVSKHCKVLKYAWIFSFKWECWFW